MGWKYISPNKAMRREVFPEPVGPIMRFNEPDLKERSPSIVRRKFRFLLEEEGVAGVDDPDADAEEEGCLSQLNTASRINT